jgi:hypothetical protein
VSLAQKIAHRKTGYLGRGPEKNGWTIMNGAVTDFQDSDIADSILNASAKVLPSHIFGSSNSIS